jgi:hypothetical protein
MELFGESQIAPLNKCLIKNSAINKIQKNHFKFLLYSPCNQTFFSSNISSDST